jgi:hypothetical protein
MIKTVKKTAKKTTSAPLFVTLEGIQVCVNRIRVDMGFTEHDGGDGYHTASPTDSNYKEGSLYILHSVAVCRSLNEECIAAGYKLDGRGELMLQYLLASLEKSDTILQVGMVDLMALVNYGAISFEYV